MTTAQVEALSLRDGLKAEYDRHVKLVRLLPIAEIQLQVDSRRYLCLRCAGFLEQLVHIVIPAYLDGKASGPALNFARSHFNRAPNLTVDALRSLFGRFGIEDSRKLDEFLDTARHDALSDLMSIRNLVAHGDSIGGAKLDPVRYIDFCMDFYDWCVAEYLL